MSKILILGYSPTLSKAPLRSYDEVWTMNHRVEQLPVDSITLHFDFHDTTWTSLKTQGYNYFKWLEKNQHRTMLTGADSRLSNSRVFPKDEILNKYERKFFTCSVPWMIAYAIEQKPIEIGIYGINLSHKSEYIHQRPPVLELIKRAKDAGIKVILPEASKLLIPKIGDDWNLFTTDRFYWDTFY